MTTLLLTTKLYAPPPRRNLVPRPRLVRRLDEGLRSECELLTLVSAPAGYGKTTLLSEWAHQASQPVAWLSLDEGDNDPARLLAYLVATLQTVDPNLGLATQSLLGAPQPPPVEALMTTLINDVAATPTPFVLVLDDYHVITEPLIHQATGFLLDRQPPQVHTVIAARQEPPLPLSRLRARGQMTEIGSDALRFTNQEAVAFFNQTMGLNLAPDEVAVLEARTEGWVAGLQLAALSLEGRTNRTAFIQDFSGDDRLVADYLADEVLSRQPAAVQDFLLRTSILERLSGPLCDAVCEIPPGDGQATLERLDRSNLFIVPLDNRRQWYRYHPLFADLLRRRLGTQDLALLHRRAAAWYESHGPVQEAIRHALAAEEFEQAARLVEVVGWDLRGRGELTTLLGWLKALPDEVIQARPRLRIGYAEALAHTGEMEAAEVHLQDTERALSEMVVNRAISPAEGDELLGQVAALQAAIAGQRDDIPRAVRLAQRATRLLSPESPYARTLVALVSGWAYHLRGKMDEAVYALREASVTGQAMDHPYLAIVTMCVRALVQKDQGRLREAVDTYRQALALAEERGGARWPVAGIAHAGLGEALYAWNELDAAAQHVETAVELCDQGGLATVSYLAYLVLALVKQAQDDNEGALAAVRQAAQVADQLGNPRVQSLVRAGEALVNLRMGRLDAATHWARAHMQDASAHRALGRELETLVLARVRLAQGDVSEATTLLRSQHQAAEAADRTGRLIEVLALEALAAQARGDADGALATLGQVLALAEPEGYVRVFLDEGAPMVDLLRVAQSQEISLDYAGTLLAAFEEVGRVRDRSPLVEPLTPRELEVLRLVAQGASNRDIAQALVVTIGTVKTHVSRLMAKLGARNRTEAVARARELGLL